MPTKFGVLILHGLTGAPSEMRPVEKALQKLGFDTETPTLAGHCDTNEAMLNVTWQEWIESARQAFATLSSRVDEVIVCGLSMGASISAMLAAENKNVAGMIMLSPTLLYDNDETKTHWFWRLVYTKGVRDFLHVVIGCFPTFGKMVYWTEKPPYGLKDERLQRQITKAIEAADFRQETKFGLFRTYWIFMYHMNYITDGLRRAAPQIKCPTLLISSLEDTLVSINNATDTYSLLSGQNKSLIMLTGCDHVLTLDLKRKYVCSLIGEFMETITGTSALPLADDNMELSVEIHNQVNPLSNSDWSQLVPGAPDLMSLVETLRKQDIHEDSCHTLVVRHRNIPIIMVPMILDRKQRQVKVAFSKNHWATSPAKTVDEQLLLEAWTQIDRISRAFANSHGVKHTDYIDAKSLALSLT